MHDDDRTIGRLLTRREVLALAGAGGVALFTRSTRPAFARAMPQCIVRPAQTEGPYFVDTKLNRPDIRSDPSDGSVRPGVPLLVTLAVSRVGAGACTPLADAHVELWQCDHMGIYSGVRDRTFDTLEKKFLRGYQVTDAQGIVKFTTVYPGWYPGRTVHLHFKIRNAPTATPGFDFTSQLYFDDELTDRVHASALYAEHAGSRSRNASDGIYRAGGAQLMLQVSGDASGYAGTFHVGLDV
jgi:protocatechuate 3,4-dioxygenase beta subunit